MQTTSDGIVPKENDTFGENYTHTHTCTHTLGHYNIRGQHEALMFSKSRVWTMERSESRFQLLVSETRKLTTLCHTAAFTGLIPVK